MQAKVVKAVTNFDRIDDFVNGDETTDVTLDGDATVPSLQKLAEEARDIAGASTIDGIPTLRADLNSRVKTVDLNSTASDKGGSLVRLRDGRTAESAITEVGSLKAYGAVGDGASSAADTSAFSAAIADSDSSRTAIPQAWMGWNTYQDMALIPPGIYDAGDFDTASRNIILVAAVPHTVVIRIPDNQYFIEATSLTDNVYVHGIHFVGGKGAFRSSRTSGNVRGYHVFQNCIFDNYTECAIQNSAPDHPYLRVIDNMFGGKSGFPTIGVAWGGYMDNCVIKGNTFLRDLYNIKIGGGTSALSGSFHIEANDFITLLGRDGSNNILPEEDQTYWDANIWFVPCKIAGGFGVNTGQAARVAYNKFGNENQVLGNPRILFAPELQADIDAGKARGAVMPDKTWTVTTTNPSGADFTHIFTGLIFEGNRIASGSPQTGPFMRSYVPELRSFRWEGDNKFDGDEHTYCIEFMGARTPSYVNTDWDITLCSDGTAAIGSPFQERFSNYPLGPIRDPNGLIPQDPMALMPGVVSDDVNYQLIRDMTVSANWSVTNATKATYANAYGASEGIEITLTASDGSTNTTLAAMPTNKLAWCQMVLSAALSNSVNSVTVDVRNFVTNKVVARRRIDLNTERTQVLFPFVTPDDGTANWQVKVSSDDYTAGTRTSFRVESGFVNVGKRPAQLGDVGGQAIAQFNTGLQKIGRNGYLFFDSSTPLPRLRALYSSVARPTSQTNGYSCMGLFGSTANRPTVRGTGDTYFDTTLGVNLFWSGSQWDDANARRRTREISAATTLTAADYGLVINCTAGAGGYTVTMPSAPPEGTTIWVRKVDAAAGSITVSSQTLSTQWKSVAFVYSATRTAWEPML
jgi:hypothetical protein